MCLLFLQRVFDVFFAVAPFVFGQLEPPARHMRAPDRRPSPGLTALGATHGPVWSPPKSLAIGTPTFFIFFNVCDRFLTFFLSVLTYAAAFGHL